MANSKLKSFLGKNAKNGGVDSITPLADEPLYLQKPGKPGVTNTFVGDRVWLDSNGNGIQDVGEKGLAGVTVTLIPEAPRGPAGVDLMVAAPRATETDANGNYRFDYVTPGKYALQFSTPDGYKFTKSNVGGDKSDSDANQQGLTEWFQLAVGQKLRSMDAGLVKTPVVEKKAVIGDKVWFDDNGNGVQDANEKGAAGVEVSLLREYVRPDVVEPNGIVTDVRPPAPIVVKTDANGVYHFDGVEPGTYSIQVKAPNGMHFTRADATKDDVRDSDVDVNGRSQLLTVKAGDKISHVDAGLVKAPLFASIGDRVWSDDNGNGVQDANEKGVAGVEVSLLREYVGSNVANSNGIVTDVRPPAPIVVKTDANGFYRFEGVEPGNYSVHMTAPNGMHFTRANATKDDVRDSDVDVNGRSDRFTVKAGDKISHVDAGLVKAPVFASIGDRVWSDDNGNGVQDANEKGVAGVEVSLLREYIEMPNLSNVSGIITDVRPPAPITVKTDANGFYRFEGVEPGTYSVHMAAPKGMHFTRANATKDDVRDSDVDVNGRSDRFTVKAGDKISHVDAGLVNKPLFASIGDRVWSDDNGNGVQDANEKGVAGVKVSLLQDLPTDDFTFARPAAPITVETDANGFYKFENVVPGSYVVELSVPGHRELTHQNVGKNDSLDSDFDAKGRSAPFKVAAGDKVTHLDAGLVPAMVVCPEEPVSIGAQGNGVMKPEVWVYEGDVLSPMPLLKEPVSAGLQGGGVNKPAVVLPDGSLSPMPLVKEPVLMGYGEQGNGFGKPEIWNFEGVVHDPMPLLDVLPGFKDVLSNDANLDVLLGKVEPLSAVLADKPLLSGFDELQIMSKLYNDVAWFA